ncbi:carbohydrate kinase [Psychroserpens sp. SPM9]|uniref:carbohydrate kinase family protein n=1 Tax=Psychroserpens sp. SPM9 TaxID=2975598 RepID=UPI0021A672A0|nr:carbohydrate kinase [Psychroserpens sp. SPM9]MDG5490713.1 carbohydrate kinase [Psychroserpens sp. SPM9]
MKKLNIVCFGEVLWDVFPSHKTIGGAPLNVAIRLQSLDNKVAIISKVGKDELGDSLLEFINEKGVNSDNVQIDSELKTGKVNVVINESGSASYEIMFPSAWDDIEITDSNTSLVASSDAFVYGSLIGRNKTSKQTLLHLLKSATYKIFDVNLRHPFYNYELLIELMRHADFIKFNDEELHEICTYLDSKSNSIEQNIAYISKKTNTSHICVTKGEKGAVMLYDSQLFENNGYRVDVVDTVGAGDSFLATLINYLLKNEHPQKAIDQACAVGAIVAQKEGANPIINREDIDALLTSN